MEEKINARSNREQSEMTAIISVSGMTQRDFEMVDGECIQRAVRRLSFRSPLSVALYKMCPNDDN